MEVLDAPSSLMPVEKNLLSYTGCGPLVPTLI